MPIDVLDLFANVTTVVPFNNDDHCGLLVKWAEKGTGFGELTIVCDKATGKWRADTESMGPEWIGPMLMRLTQTDGREEAAALAQSRPVLAFLIYRRLWWRTLLGSDDTAMANLATDQVSALDVEIRRLKADTAPPAGKE